MRGQIVEVEPIRAFSIYFWNLNYDFYDLDHMLYSLNLCLRLNSIPARRSRS